MTDASLNPLLKKKYYIWESKLYTQPPSLTILKLKYGSGDSCTSSDYYPNMTASRLTVSSSPPDLNTNTNPNPNTSNYTLFSNVSLLGAQKYIVDAINNLTTDIALAQSCDTSSRYNGPSSKAFGCCSGSMIKPICSQTFQNFLDPDYTPGTEYLPVNSETLKNPLLKMKDYVYVDSLKKKSFCQQVNDISTLIQDFTSLYNTLRDGSEWTTYINNINNRDPNPNYQQMLTLRNKLDMKLQSLLNNTDLNNPQYQSKLQLDSTVYTTVLWTVLATSVLYYVFIKI